MTLVDRSRWTPTIVPADNWHPRSISTTTLQQSERQSQAANRHDSDQALT